VEKKFWEELVTLTFLQIYQSKNIYSDSQKLKINTREKNVYFLAPTAGAFSQGMLPTYVSRSERRTKSQYED